MRVPTHPPAPPAASSSRTHPTDSPVTELDVRDDLRNRREPFSRIMAAVETVPQDGVLHLRATFEPVPLITLLGKRGYVSESVQHGPDDWSAWFWRSTGANDAGERTSVCAPAAAGSAATDDESDDVHLDVRGLEAPEPMVRTLAALEALAPGRTLVQVNVRVPQFLLPILAERGFDWEIDESPADRVLVRIRRGGRDARVDFATRPPSRRHLVSQQPLELDVRVIPPRDKHPTIFRAFDGLTSGQSMILVNDHDPRPLRYQLAAERPETFEWTYQEQGPDVWRVKIDRR